MKTHCRCRNCNARRALRRHPDDYTTQPRCRCGSRNWRADKFRMRVERAIWKKNTCHSDCYAFPHRIGSGECKFKTQGIYKD